MDTFLGPDLTLSEYVAKHVKKSTTNQQNSFHEMRGLIRGMGIMTALHKEVFRLYDDANEKKGDKEDEFIKNIDISKVARNIRKFLEEHYLNYPSYELDYINDSEVITNIFKKYHEEYIGKM